MKVFGRGKANSVSLCIYLCKTMELYKASENTDVWYSAFHCRNTISSAPVLSLKSLDCRHNRLSQSLQLKEGSNVCAVTLPPINETRLMMAIDNHTVFVLPTNRHHWVAAKWDKSTAVFQVSAVWKSHNNKCKHSNLLKRHTHSSAVLWPWCCSDKVDLVWSQVRSLAQPMTSHHQKKNMLSNIASAPDADPDKHVCRCTASKFGHGPFS